MANKIESVLVRELQLFAVYMSCSSNSHAQLFSYEIAFCASGPREASGAQKDEVLTGGFFAWRSDRHRIDCVVTVPSKEKALAVEHHLVAIHSHRAHTEARCGGIQRSAPDGSSMQICQCQWMMRTTQNRIEGPKKYSRETYGGPSVTTAV